MQIEIRGISPWFFHITLVYFYKNLLQKYFFHSHYYGILQKFYTAAVTTISTSRSLSASAASTQALAG